jgi:AbrB family looped-hinge helix DNA binding protein
MKTTIDAAGRLVIPKEIRRQAGLKPGMELEVRLEDGHIEIEPASLPVRLVRKGRFLVASTDTQERLTTDIVEQIRDEIQRERFGL